MEIPASTRAAPPLMVVRPAPPQEQGVASPSRRGHGDGGDGIKTQGHQEGGGDGGRGAGAGGALQEDGHHHAHHDQLDTAVLAADPGHGVLHVLNGAGALEGVEDDEGAKDHGHDLQALLDALPQQAVQDHDVLLEGQTADVEIRERQQHRPHQRQRRHLHGGLFERQDAHQHECDGADCQHEIDETHNADLSLLCFIQKEGGSV